MDMSRASGHRVARLHECVDRGVLAHGAGEVVGRPRKRLIDDGNIVLELGGGDVVAELGVDLLRPDRGARVHHSRPLLDGRFENIISNSYYAIEEFADLKDLFLQH